MAGKDASADEYKKIWLRAKKAQVTLKKRCPLGKSLTNNAGRCGQLWPHRPASGGTALRTLHHNSVGNVLIERQGGLLPICTHNHVVVFTGDNRHAGTE